jgi:hypothetical protein
MSAQPLALRHEARAVPVEVPPLPHLQAMAVATWRGRMRNEYGSARVFEGLAQQLARVGFDAASVRACAAFADEERRHGVLRVAVVEALGAEAVATLDEPVVFPSHRDASSPREAVLRNLLSISCLSETVAVSLIGAEREEMPEGSLRTLLTTIWSDEVGHARYGWRLVTELAPDLDAHERDGLARYLRLAFAHLERHELAHLPTEQVPPPEGVLLGLCAGRDARALFYDTVTDVIVPGLEALGLAADAAWRARMV